MKILIFWDIYWRIWRTGLKKELPGLIKKYSPDFVVANVDNVSSGRWAIEKHIIELEKMGIDIFTSGDHIFDNFIKIKDYIDKPNSKMLLFANLYDDELSSKWFKIFEKNGKKLWVIHLQWEALMPHRVNNPFKTVESLFEKNDFSNLDWLIVDFHKETTAEGYGLANYLDGKVSFVFGTHTHVQTNDEIILKNGTGLISDVGMNWPLNSVIWATFDSVKNRFMTWIMKWKIEQSLDDNYVVNWVFVEIWEEKKCKNIEKIRIRGK